MPLDWVVYDARPTKEQAKRVYAELKKLKPTMFFYDVVTEDSYLEKMIDHGLPGAADLQDAPRMSPTSVNIFDKIEAGGPYYKSGSTLRKGLTETAKQLRTGHDSLVTRLMTKGAGCENFVVGYGIKVPGQIVEPWAIGDPVEEIYIILQGTMKLHYQPGPGFFDASKDKFIVLKKGDVCSLPPNHWYWSEAVGREPVLNVFVMSPPVRGPLRQSRSQNPF